MHKSVTTTINTLLDERYDEIADKIETQGVATYFELLTSMSYGDTARRAAEYGVSHKKPFVARNETVLIDMTLQELRADFISTVKSQVQETRYCEYARATIVNDTLMIMFFCVPAKVAA